MTQNLAGNLKKLSWIYRLGGKLKCEMQYRSEQDDQHQHAARGTATMITVAAAGIDQVISRTIDREVADRYYGLLCMCRSSRCCQIHRGKAEWWRFTTAMSGERRPLNRQGLLNTPMTVSGGSKHDKADRRILQLITWSIPAAASRPWLPLP